MRNTAPAGAEVRTPATPAPAGRPAYRYYDWIMVSFVVILLLSNTAAVKAVQIGPWIAGGDILIFPISYIFGDILTEVYGYARSRRVIWTGFAANAFMAVFYMLVGFLPAAPDWPNQGAYMAILGQTPRIVLGSIIAFFAGEFCNSYVLAKLKILTRGRWLWTRTIGSTLVGQTVDTTIFVTVVFAGVLPFADVFAIVRFGIFSKVVYETLATPITYRVVHWLKQAEGIDHYDVGTDFNPFTLDQTGGRDLTPGGVLAD